MPTDRVLVEIITAANMAGIEQAQTGFLKLSATTIGLAAVMGILVVVGKAGIENSKKQEEAANLLTQAYATQKDTLAAHRAEIDKFLATNAAFISDQYDTEAALAAVIRSGENETDAMRILNDALDLAAIKHMAVSEAAKMEVLVLAGNSRALRELGVTTVEYNAIMKDKLLTTEEKHLALLTLIEQRTAKGRDTVDSLTQSQNKLTIAWQNFTAKIGPPLLQMWGKLNEALATGVDLLSIYLDLMHKIHDLGASFMSKGGLDPNINPATGKPLFGKAAGGPVSPGSAYTVGERGPETLVMGDQGGTIVPNGSSRPTEIHIHIDQGAYIDGPSIDKLSQVIAQRLRMAPGY